MTMDSKEPDMEDKLKQIKIICSGFKSDDRHQRKKQLQALQKYISEIKPNDDELRQIFNENHIYILNTLRDKSEDVRETAIKLISFLIVDVFPINDFYLTYVFPILVERIGSVEIVEESEEIRLSMLRFLYDIIKKYSGTPQLKPFLNDCTGILCETVKDKFPAIKELSCECIINLANALPRDFHMQAESFLKPVLTCLTHQRFKVRQNAIICIGEVFMHCSYKAVDIVMVPIAEKLFDQMPIIRRTVSQVAAKWLTEYRDRYSYFHKILPLLLTELNDEVLETRQEAHDLWNKVGLQYLRENEKDFKDQMDFLIEPPKYYLDYLERPNLGCRVLVQRHVGKIVQAIANELISWQVDVRIRCSQLLCSIALHSETYITMHLQDILPAMYSAGRDDDLRVVENITRSSEIIGIFVPFNTWIKLIIPQLENAPHYGHLTVLNGLISGSPKDLIGNELEAVTAVLSSNPVCYSRKRKYQLEMIKCVLNIGDKCSKPATSNEAYHLFKITISCVALKDVENANLNIELVAKLAHKFQVNVSDFWKFHLDRLLSEIEVDPYSWTMVTSEKCIFDLILTESNEAFGENLNRILNILKQCLNVECDPEARLKTFFSLSVAFEKNNLFARDNNATVFFEELIEHVFVPSLVWKAGVTCEAMRTMVATCLKTALCFVNNFDLLDVKKIYLQIEKLLPLLLSLIEDASFKSRQLSIECLVLSKEISAKEDAWTLENLIKVYPEILKRLDDPIEKVRETAIKSLIIIFSSCPADFSCYNYKAHHELIIDTLLTHFDDDEEHIHELIHDSLISVGKINKELLLNKIEKHKPLLLNQGRCEKIIDYFQ